MEERLSAKEQEEQFQSALKHYRLHNDKRSYDIMFIRVYEACKANAKCLLKVSLDDMVFHDRLMRAVDTCMTYITKEHYNKKRELVPPCDPNKLITFCHLPTLGAFCGPKAIKEDAELSYEQSVENGYDIPTNIIGEIIDGHNL